MTIWQRTATVLVAVLVVGGCGAATDLVESDPTSPTGPTSPPPSPTTPTTPTSPPPTTPATPTVVEPEVGQCRRTDPVLSAIGGSEEARRPVSCGETHNAQTYFVGLMNESAQAAARSNEPSRLRAQVAGICGRKLTDWLGGSGEDVALSVFHFIVGAPGPNEIGPGARWFSCDVYAIRADNGLKLAALPGTTRGVLSSGRSDAWDRCNRGGFADGTTNIVVCTRAHSYRAVAAIHLGDPATDYPGSNALDRRLTADCVAPIRAYLGTPEGFDYGATWPRRGSWNEGDRWGVCFLRTTS